MTAQKRHPFEKLVDETLDAVDDSGTEGLSPNQVQVLGFHWLSVKLNGNQNSKKFWLSIAPALTAISAGVAVGIAKMLSV